LSLASAIKVAGRAAAKVDGTKVSIQRGDVKIDDVPCGKGSSEFETIGADGAVVTIRSQHFLILADKYDFGDGPVEPKRSDKIIDAQADGDHTYELLNLPGKPSFRKSDPWGQRWRIHTKEVAKPA
jgi:hypothetical protein